MKMSSKFERVEANSTTNLKNAMDMMAIISDDMYRNTALTNLNTGAHGAHSFSFKMVKVIHDLFSNNQEWQLTDESTEEYYQIVETFVKQVKLMGLLEA